MSDIGTKQIMQDNLNYYLASKSIDKRTMAEDLGVKQSTFYSWCNGQSYPPINRIEQIADYLGVDKMDLINRHDSLYIEMKALNNLPADSIKKKLIRKIAQMSDEKAEKLNAFIELLES